MMICAINIIKAQIVTKNIKITAKNITHLSQWENAEDFDLPDFIQFIQLERVDF